MNEQEVVRVITGLRKKHGDYFSLTLKYLTAKGKVRKRSGHFLCLTEDNVLILQNEDKGGTGRYTLARIKAISKSTKVV